MHACLLFSLSSCAAAFVTTSPGCATCGTTVGIKGVHAFKIEPLPDLAECVGVRWKTYSTGDDAWQPHVPILVRLPSGEPHPVLPLPVPVSTQETIRTIFAERHLLDAQLAAFEDLFTKRWTFNDFAPWCLQPILVACRRGNGLFFSRFCLPF